LPGRYAPVRKIVLVGVSGGIGYLNGFFGNFFRLRVCCFGLSSWGGVAFAGTAAATTAATATLFARSFAFFRNRCGALGRSGLDDCGFRCWLNGLGHGRCVHFGRRLAFGAAATAAASTASGTSVLRFFSYFALFVDGRSCLADGGNLNRRLDWTFRFLRCLLTWP
jgi:hypothetical protein